jgi:SAM-dependent methyltransferase
MSRQAWEAAEVVAAYTGRRTLFPFEQQLFERHISTGDRILDLGVGTGRTVDWLSRRASRYVALDYSEAMVGACRAAFPGVEVHACDAADLSRFDDAAFDVVVFSYNGIDYLSDEGRARCLREIRRVLAPGGRFILSRHTPAAWMPDTDSSWAFRHTLRRLAHLPHAFARTRTVLDPVLTGIGGGRLETKTASPRAVRDELAFGFTPLEIEPHAARKTWVYYAFGRR